MIIQKVVAHNRIEPSLLSFRAPNGIEIKLDVQFLTRLGTAYTADLAAQLQLTGRSNNRTTYYQMPAIDVVNGRTRAVIPASTFTDPNGYRLRITGTWGGEPTLLAQGIALPIAAAGPDAGPRDTIDNIPLSLDYNEPANLTIKLWDDVSKSNPFELTTATVTANVYTARGGTVLAPFTVTIVSANEVLLTLTAAQVNTLPNSCWWGLAVASSAGSTTLAEGEVTVTGTVIPPLTNTTASYDYLKPSSGDVNPVGGQIIHNAITQNILKVAKTTNLSVDLSATLALVTAGDEIVIGATTWVVGLTYEAAGWYEFKVSPVAQSATTGVTTVTFRRP